MYDLLNISLSFNKEYQYLRPLQVLVQRSSKSFVVYKFRGRILVTDEDSTTEPVTKETFSLCDKECTVLSFFLV